MNPFLLRMIPVCFCLALFSSCRQGNELNANVQNKVTPQNFEITCIFAASELDNYFQISRDKPRFMDTSFPENITAVNDQIKQNCNQNAAGKILLNYLNSEVFLTDSKILKLDTDYIAHQIEMLKGSANDKFLHLKTIAEVIFRITFYEERKEMNIEDNSLFVERLASVNGDTIEVGLHEKYPFPTEFFFNHYPDKEIYELKTEWIQGGNKPGVIKLENLKIQTSLFTIDQDVYIKTIR